MDARRVWVGVWVSASGKPISKARTLGISAGNSSRLLPSAQPWIIERVKTYQAWPGGRSREERSFRHERRFELHGTDPEPGLRLTLYLPQYTFPCVVRRRTAYMYHRQASAVRIRRTCVLDM